MPFLRVDDALNYVLMVKHADDERPPPLRAHTTTTLAVQLADSGYHAIVDRADGALVAGFFWRPLIHSQGNTVYAHAWHRNLHLYLHRLVIGAAPRESVDHRNGDGLDNRRLNLRVASDSQNQANRGKDKARRRAEFTSQYKGVYWDKSRGRWMVMIHDGKSRSLGRFDDEEQAARVYDQEALKVWGEFARLNFPL